jgi:hypothetical protein
MDLGYSEGRPSFEVREMRSVAKASLFMLVATVLGVQLITLSTEGTKAQACDDGGVEGDLTGSADEAVILGRAASLCSSEVLLMTGQPESFYTYEIVCSTDRSQASIGICSATPCPTSFYALRTIHFPDGSSEPAGFRCITLDQATASPGVTAAQVFAAVRRVKLPGGEIEITPQLRGLANLESFFRLQGANQPPVDLHVGGSTVHASFRVLEYRWSFGDGRTLVTEGPGRPGLASEVRAAWPQRGRYQVEVTVMWVAQASLDGQPVGQVDDLVSQAQTTYPVAELKTVLTG